MLRPRTWSFWENAENEANPEQFTASNGYFEKLKKRIDIHSVITSYDVKTAKVFVQILTN